MSAARKGISPASMQSPSGSAKGLKMKIPAMSAEYMEAMHILNESNLNQACAMLLDEQNENVEKLLELYYKCDQAYKVVQKHQPAGNNNNSNNNMTLSGLPGAPNLSIPSSKKGMTTGPRPKLKKMGTTVTSSSSSSLSSSGSSNPTQSKMGTVPMRRTAAKANSVGAIKTSTTTTTTTADNHHHNDGNTIVPPASKKARVASAPSAMAAATVTAAAAAAAATAATGTGNEKVMAPPQSALNFLAKLNKDKEQQQQSSSSSSSAGGNSNENATAASEPKSPLRKNPPRGLLHHRRASGP